MEYSKIISMVVLVLMALAGLIVVVYDLCFLNTSNFPMITGFLLGIPVTWATSTLGIHAGVDAMQNALNTSNLSNSTIAITQPVTQPVAQPVSTSIVSPMQGH
jgi:hypothetical protein